MKLITRRLLVVATAACFASTAQTTQAGQWLDSIFGRRQAAYPVGAPVPINGQPVNGQPVNGQPVNGPIAAYSPGTYPSLGYVPPSYANLNSNQSLGYGNYISPPNNNSPLLAPGIPQTVAGYLPTAAYDTQWARTPVTYYRPVTAFDPRYGTTVTSLQPCTSFQYQAQRQPVLAPRPLLGEYGLQANRWPSITGPGYNATGLANSAMYAPVAQPYQNIPMGGMPMMGLPSNTAPMGGGGIASGMPASTLPITSMPYTNPSQPNLGQAAFYNGQNYNGQNYYGQNYYGQNYNGQVVANPVYSSSLPIGSGVVPTAAWMPSASACANGMCPQPTNASNTPYVPGAASVTPVGPPTYSATPFGQPANPNVGFAPATINPYANTINPYANTNPYGALPASGQSMQPNQVMPPITNPYANPNPNPNPYANPNVDPESMRRPSLGGSSASNNVKTLPMVAIDRGSNSAQSEAPNAIDNSSVLLKPRNALAMGDAAPEPSPLVPNMTNSMQDIPRTLTPRENYGMQPLSAPDDFDSKPRWTPTLLEPDDRTVMERSNRIRLQEVRNSAVSAVALEPTKSNRNTIQLVSGIETKKSEPSENGVIRFRAVTTLK